MKRITGIPTIPAAEADDMDEEELALVIRSVVLEQRSGMFTFVRGEWCAIGNRQLQVSQETVPYREPVR